MANRLQKLCALLIEEGYGPCCAKIFNMLAGSGPLARSELTKRLSIKPRLLHQSLATLIQNHILLFSSLTDRISYFHINWVRAYSLARADCCTSVIERRYGKDAAKIVAHLNQMGHATVDDLTKAFQLGPDSKRDSGIENRNGHTDENEMTNGVRPGHMSEPPSSDKITTEAQLHAVLRKMLRLGFLLKVGRRSCIPHVDLETEIEGTVMHDQFRDENIHGAESEDKFKQAVKELKHEWRYADEYSESHDIDAEDPWFAHSEENARKRKSSEVDAGGSAKRVKLNGVRAQTTASNGTATPSGSISKLPKHMRLRVNHEQCTMAVRSDRLERLSERVMGSTAASVYGALLQVLEGKILARDQNTHRETEAGDEGSADEDELITATVEELHQLLDHSINLSDSIMNQSNKQTNGAGGRKKKGKLGYEDEDNRALGIKTEIFSESEDENLTHGPDSPSKLETRYKLVEEHLKLLEEHEKSFCKRVGDNGHGQWHVNFPALTESLVETLIDQTVTDRWSRTHTRILRTIREKGKLSNKQVKINTMIVENELQPRMTQLQFAGFLDSQEVPKDNKRENENTIFLWSHDTKRVQALLLQQTYQAMFNAIRRLISERKKMKTIFDKLELANDEGWDPDLNKNENEQLEEWEKLEQKIVTSLRRLDDDVALLRDFSGEDVSLKS